MKTATNLSRRIATLMDDLSKNEEHTDWRQETMRVYDLTWSIVTLHNLGLAYPTPSAKERLEDLFNVVSKYHAKFYG